VVDVLAEVSIGLLVWRPTSLAIALILRIPGVSWVLTPILTPSFLMTVFRHPHAKAAVSTLLKTRHAPRGVATLLRHHVVLGKICEEPDTVERIALLVGEPGLGKFLQGFLVVADPEQLARFLRNSATGSLIAALVLRSCPAKAAALVYDERTPLAAAVAGVFQQPTMDLWGTWLTKNHGVDQWVGSWLNDPRGASFAREVLLTPGFIDWVERYLRHEDAKAFVIRLVQQPGVCRFVTWLNRDAAMCRFFAQIASRDSAIEFVTEMLLEPGLDRFMVSLLLRPGNDAALRSMLEHWVRAERSLERVAMTWAQQPRTSQSLARVIMSPGFLDRFVLRRLLLQPGLAEVVVEAMVLVGVRGLRDTVLPLLLSTFAAVLALAASEARSGLDLEIAPLLEELQGADSLFGLAALLLG